MVQETLNDIVMRIVPEDGYSSSESETFIREVIREQCDSGFRVQFDYCTALPPMPSGKRGFVMSKVRLFPRTYAPVE